MIEYETWGPFLGENPPRSTRNPLSRTAMAFVVLMALALIIGALIGVNYV